jgi:hypothetical protein
MELRVAIGMVRSLARLAIGLQAVIKLDSRSSGPRGVIPRHDGIPATGAVKKQIQLFADDA